MRLPAAIQHALPPDLPPRQVGRKLHLGCFDRPIDGWLNTDITPHLFIAKIPLLASALYRAGRMTEERYRQHRRGVFKNVRYLNVTKPFRFATSSFDCVYSSHMLEHIPKPRVAGLFQEIHRVLRSGGVVRTVVPDLDYFIAHYDAEDPDRFLAGLLEMDHPASKNRHHWMYNRCSLSRLLTAQGFAEVRVCVFRQGRCADLDRLDNRPDHSLYVEAIKP